MRTSLPIPESQSPPTASQQSVHEKCAEHSSAESSWRSGLTGHGASAGGSVPSGSGSSTGSQFDFSAIRSFRHLSNESRVQRDPDVGRSGRSLRADVAGSVEHVLRAPGRPLEAHVRSEFEPRFQTDFRDVRIHTDSVAADSANALRARAYALGRDIVFGAGQYRPHTETGRRLIAHELTHTIQQRSVPPLSAEKLRRVSMTSRSHPAEHEARSVSALLTSRTTVGKGSGSVTPAMRTGPIIAREDADHPPATPATDEDRRAMTDGAVRWLDGLTDQVSTMRRVAAAEKGAAADAATGAGAFHQIMNQNRLAQLLRNAKSVFEAQRSEQPYVTMPHDDPDQIRLGEAYARARDQLSQAIHEAQANAADLADAGVKSAELAGYRENQLLLLESNPYGSVARTSFTSNELQISSGGRATVRSDVDEIIAHLHEYNLAGDGAERIRNALRNAVPHVGQTAGAPAPGVEQDATVAATIQPILERLAAIHWGVNEAASRLERAEAQVRTFAGDTVANAAIGNIIQSHFSTRDSGYATLLADRYARMARELRGSGSLMVHAPDPNDSHCGVGSIGGGFSVTQAHADANHFYFCADITVGDDEAVSTIIHETAHAVIPALGAAGAVQSSTTTPRDRSYAGERIYRHLTTEEALDNAESYAYCVDELLGIQVRRDAPPNDQITGCADPGPVEDAIARATYRIRLAAMWADQTNDRFRRAGRALTQNEIGIVQEGFPGAAAQRAQDVLNVLATLSARLAYYIPADCRTASDREARAGGLIYGPAYAASASGVRATSRTYPAATFRICPDWFNQTAEVRENTLTQILALRYNDSIPAGDLVGYADLIRFVQQAAHPSVANRNLAAHQAADAPPAPGPGQQP